MKLVRLLVIGFGCVGAACGGKLLSESGGGSGGGEVEGGLGPGSIDGGSGVPWLAFDSDRDGTRGIYLIHEDGTGRFRLTTSSFVEEQPAFSPDGTKLAYASNAK